MSHHVEVFAEDGYFTTWGWQCFEPGCRAEATAESDAGLHALETS